MKRHDLKWLGRLAAACSLLTFVPMQRPADAVGLGVHTTDDNTLNSAYNNFSTWLGQTVHYRVVFTARGSWSDYSNPFTLASGAQWIAQDPNNWEVMTMGLLLDTSTADDFTPITSGAQDATWQTLAHNLVNNGMADRTIIRLGWEHNGDWFTWRSVNNPTGYKAAFQHVVSLIRPIAPNVKFDWCSNRGSSPNSAHQQIDWRAAYPGDAYVDMMGLDTYDQWAGGSWTNILGTANSGDAGLNDLRYFAQLHGKTESYPEWSCSFNTTTGASPGNDNPTFVQNMHDWIFAAPASVTYQSYYDTMSGGPQGAVYYNGGTIRATNASAKYRSLSWSSATVPAAPASLNATGGNAQVTLSWNASSGATSYNVYRGTTAGGESTTAISTGVTTTVFVDTGRTNGTAYYYKVKAVNGAGTSGYSNEASATPSGSAPVIAINAGGAASGSFIADTDNNGGSIFSSTNTITTTGVTNPAPQAVYQDVRWNTAFTYTIPGLTAGAPYVVRLHFAELTWTAAGQRKFNVAINGTSVLTNFDIFATAGGQNKANVQQFNATANGSGQLVIAFTQASPVVDNPEIGGIEILNGTASAPAAPTGLGATGGNAQVGLSWTASSGATSYNVYRGTTAGGESTTAIATGITGTTYTNTGLTNGTTYFYKVAAVNSAGTSGYSNEASATPVAPPSNTHSGTWAAKGKVTGGWHNMYESRTVPGSTAYTASFWVKGSGVITLRVMNSTWATTVSSAQVTATGTWQQINLSFNTGLNTTLIFALSDSGASGTLYLDDAYMGTSGGTNVLLNPGFESGNTSWTIDSAPTFAILQNP